MTVEWFESGEDAMAGPCEPKVPCRVMETRACSVQRPDATDWREALAYPTSECPPGACARFGPDAPIPEPDSFPAVDGMPLREWVEQGDRVRVGIDPASDGSAAVAVERDGVVTILSWS